MLTHWGPLVIESDGDKVVATHPHPSDPDPSILNDSVLDAHRCRVLGPAVRQSYLANGAGSATDKRGNEPFVEVDWDTALDLVAAELARVRADHGNEAIFAGSYGWGSAGRFHAPAGQLHRFMRQFGGHTDVRGTYSASAAETIVPYVIGMGYHAAIGQQTSWATICEHAELFVSFGSLRLTNSQVTYGGQGPHHIRPWVEEARGAGVEFVSITPIGDDHVDSRWVNIRPGTDVALMCGLAHTLVADGLADEGFLGRYCHGWPEVRRYLMGCDDGQAKDAQWASQITAIDEAVIVNLAREMAAKRTTINLALSVQRSDHGEQSYWMAFVLGSVLGQIGLPGGGVAFPFGAQGNTGAGQLRKRVPGIPIAGQSPDMTVIPVSRVVEMLEQPGTEFEYNGDTGIYPDIDLVYWAGGNVFHHHQDLNRLVQAWSKPQTIVVHEPFWTPTAKRADIVLPTTTPLERNDLGGGDNILVAMSKSVVGPGQPRDDHEIFAELADRLGFRSAFTLDKTPDEWVEALYEQFRSQNTYAEPFAEFWERGWVRHPDMAEMGRNNAVFLSSFRADPDANPLPTPSGRIELYSQAIAGFGYRDCPGHPQWIEPYEWLGSVHAESDHLHLVSNQPTARLHSQYDHSALSQKTKVAGREPARLNPADALNRGISEGDVVRVYNQRGSCLAGAVVSDQVSRGVIQIATGAWYDPDHTGMCKHGNPNVLTRDKGTSKLAQGPTAHTCLVKVERFDAVPPAVTAYDPPEFVDGLD